MMCDDSADEGKERFWGGPRIFLAKNGAAGEISLRNTAIVVCRLVSHAFNSHYHTTSSSKVHNNLVQK